MHLLHVTVLFYETSSPKGNDHSPVQCAKVKSHLKKQQKKKQTKKTTNINGPWKPEARNQTRPSFYACTGYKQL